MISHNRINIISSLISIILYSFVNKICLACEEMQIHCAPCTPSQLASLKRGSIIPSSADQCGLITKSDVERLISYLNSSDLNDNEKRNTTRDRTSSISSPLPHKRARITSPSSPSRPHSVSSQESAVTTNIYQKIENKKVKGDYSKIDEQFEQSFQKEDRDNASPIACLEAIPSSPNGTQKEARFEEDKKARYIHVN